SQGGRPADSERSARSGSADGGDSSGPPAAGRKKLQLAPRTAPVEKDAKLPATRPSIFGAGKPHDELAWEEKHKKMLEEKAKADAAAAAKKPPAVVSPDAPRKPEA
ncbi:unnamed protein product, partial [Phaeothamnion confervicola]